ncbi:MAG TPA: nuclease-related domain-containing protein [Verrucomicrobiae bacterium]|nr:nuclease-related domain-containing protein [Verrucomicrobiae bacterium]
MEAWHRVCGTDGVSIAGQSTRRLVERRRGIRRKICILGFVMLGLVVPTYFVMPVTIWFLFSLALFWVIDHFFIGWADFIIRREGHAQRGAEAEESVGDVLNRLPPAGYLVIHDVIAYFGNIDHVVVRKDGAVFLIETKAHAGTINHRRAHQFVNQTLRNIYWLRDFLKSQTGIEPWINAAIVFPNAYVSVRGELRGISIIHLNFLERWMSRQTKVETTARNLWSQRETVRTILTVSRS